MKSLTMQFSLAISYCCILYPDVFHFPQCPVLKYPQPALNVKDKISHMQKGKAIPLQAWTGPGGCRRLRPPDPETFGT